MFKFPQTFGESYENYITVPILKELCKSKGFKINEDRCTLVKDIENYANQSEENEEEVLTWIDENIRAGIKDIYIRQIIIPKEDLWKLRDEKYLETVLINKLLDVNYQHITHDYYKKEPAFVKYKYNIEKIELNFIFVEGYIL